MSIRTTVIAVPLAATVLIASGCQQIEQSTGIGTETQTGVAVGAAAGGLIAAAAGASTGWIIASTVLGAVAGGLIADYMTEDDKAMAGETTTNALETQPNGTTSAWKNPDSGNSGEVVVNETFYKDDGTPCRRFTQTVNAGGQTESAPGTACRNPDGTWQIQS